MLAGTSRLVQKMLPTGWADVVDELPTGWADVVEGAFSIPNLADVAKMEMLHDLCSCSLLHIDHWVI